MSTAHGKVRRVDAPGVHAPLSYATIHKDPVAGVAPNLADYDATRAGFSWDAAAKAELDGLPGGGLNIAYETIDRHATGPLAQKTAIRWLAKDGGVHDFTYSRLKELTARFANVLRSLGVGPGDRVFALAGRVPELYIAALGTLKYRGVFCPLFSAFGPEPIHMRLTIGDGRVLVTTPALYHRMVAPLRDRLPGLKHVLLIGDADQPPDDPGVHDLGALMADADADFVIPRTRPEDLALLHFTGGTAGKPKGALHAHNAMVAHLTTARFALDLRQEDVFWCTADPGEVTGISYGLLAPLSLGATLIVDEHEFDAERWYRILQDHKVTVWYTAPTAVRMMMRRGTDLVGRYDTSHLRFLSTVGEPLEPEAVRWGQEAFGLPIHDNWSQSETGDIMIANYAAMDIKPGSMGKPVPGIDAAIVEPLLDGGVRPIAEPDREGELAFKPEWPSLFRGYLNEKTRYRRSFVSGWYLTGDLARRDADGYYWFIGRADDMIKSAGHLIGPFEVESALLEHPAVAEVAVIGKPDPVAMEVVKAFVVLQPGTEPTLDLNRELLDFSGTRLGAAMAPREIEFTDQLPKTRSGKIMRRLLKARELGLPEGDLSTLEPFRP
jgi:acetyl-CoA synthetase